MNLEKALMNISAFFERKKKEGIIMTIKDRQAIIVNLCVPTEKKLFLVFIFCFCLFSRFFILIKVIMLLSI